MNLLIKNSHVIDPHSGLDGRFDILIKNKKIIDIKKNIKDKNAKLINASDMITAPGFIDMHVHLREPGQEHKETIETGARAAAAGGFTSLACMPNTSPVNDSSGITKYIVSRAQKSADVNVFPIASLSVKQKGKALTEMADLIQSGAIAFSDDGMPIQNSELMRRGLEYAKQWEALIIDHCEDLDLSSNGVMNEGHYSYLLGLKGIPDYSEDVMVARNIILAEKTDSRLHLAHISTKGSVEIIRRAKEKGVKITSEVTPHHLFLDDSLLSSYSTDLKVNPPLRTKQDNKSLINAVKTGVIDVFATDHAPHSPDEKDVEFNAAPFGINGLETAVSLILDKLVHTEVISMNQCVDMFSCRPAKILGLNSKGKIEKGADADLTVIDPQKKITVDVHKFRSQSRNNPFHNWELKGSPVMTIVGGKIVYSDLH
ncbi:MAG: amidohydrolase family protein [Candidatus Aminicenantes bacterium]|nr:amidohydrolase family protein [Candidatus Aminicenantes bacterium]